MSFQDQIDKAGSAYDLLSKPLPPSQIFPYPNFHTNWRDEQEAWTKTAELFNQSWHMTDLYIECYDKLKLLSDTYENRYKNLDARSATQSVAVKSNRYVIGDVILFG